MAKISLLVTDIFGLAFGSHVFWATVLIVFSLMANISLLFKDLFSLAFGFHLF
jgi:hypothetical protein